MFATFVTSRCDTVLGLCDGATRLQVTDKLCDKCDLHLVSAEYPKVRLVILVTSTGKNPRFVTIVTDEAVTAVIHLCHLSPTDSLHFCAQNKSPFGADSAHTGCISCDEALHKRVVEFHGRPQSSRMHSGRGRGRGRGRGQQRGRGRPF